MMLLRVWCAVRKESMDRLFWKYSSEGGGGSSKARWWVVVEWRWENQTDQGDGLLDDFWVVWWGRWGLGLLLGWLGLSLS